MDAVTGESNTTNNCSGSVQVTVSATLTGPDLTIYAIVAATSPDGTPPGGTITLNAEVRNGGDESSAATTLRYYQSTDAAITTTDTSVGTDPVGVLSAGATTSTLEWKEWYRPSWQRYVPEVLPLKPSPDGSPNVLMVWRLIGASAIKCCYAAAGSGTGVEETGLRAPVSRKTSIRAHKGIVVAKKMCRKVSRRMVRPACIAGVRISRPNFRAPCGRTKL